MVATPGSSRHILCVVFVLLASVTHGQSTRRLEAPAETPAAKATVCVDNVSHEIKIQVDTPATEPLRLYRDYLPWARHGSIFIQALRLDRWEPVPEAIPISDPTGAPVDVPAGTRLAGDVSLDERFPSLEAVLKETDVVVFWAFRLRAPDWTVEAAAGTAILSRERGLAIPGAVSRSCTDHHVHLTRRAN